MAPGAQQGSQPVRPRAWALQDRGRDQRRLCGGRGAGPVFLVARGRGGFAVGSPPSTGAKGTDMSAESDAYVEKRKAWDQATEKVDGLIAKLKVIQPLIANWRDHYLGPPWGFPQIYAKGRTA